MNDDLPVLCCENTKTHPAHEWVNYDIDRNTHEHVWCTGDFLTTP